MELSLDSGIYYIVSSFDATYYIGSTKNFHRREVQHFSDLRGGHHPNMHLQNAVNKYGLDKFTFKIMERVEPKKILLREQEYLDDANWNHLYNMNRKAESGGSDYTRKRVVLLNLDGFVVEEFASAQDVMRYFGGTTQISNLNTDMVHYRAYRVVTFDFYNSHYDDIIMWKNHTNDNLNRELIQERIDKINYHRTEGVGIKTTYSSAEPERFANGAF